MVYWQYGKTNERMGRAEKLFARRLGRKSKREQSDLSDPEK